MKKVTLVILASGFSRRFGKNKLLEDLEGKPLILHTIDNAMKSGISEVVVVVEPGNGEVLNLIPSGARTVENHGRSMGLSSAVRVGVGSVFPDSDAVLFMVGDQPFVTAVLINKIIGKFKNDNCRIVSCRLEGVLKNPMLFSREYFDELSRIENDVGARQVALKHLDSVCAVDITDPVTLIDIDTEKDLEKARKILMKKNS